jgi:hypothetical protein
MSNNHGFRHGVNFAMFMAKWNKLPALHSLSANGWLLLYSLLIEYRPDKPNIWHMTDEVAALRLGCSMPTAGKVVRELIEKGWLREERAGGLSGPRQARSRVVSLSQYKTAARPAESWRYENWMPSVHSNAQKNDAERTKK